MSAVTVLLVQSGLVLAQAPAEAPLSPYAQVPNGAASAPYVPVAVGAASPYAPEAGGAASPYAPVAVGVASPYAPEAGEAAPPPPAAAPAQAGPAALPPLTATNPATGAAAGCSGACATAEGAPAERNDRFRVSAEYLWWHVQGGTPSELHSVLSASGIDVHSLLGTLPLNRFRSGVRGFAEFSPGDDWLTFEVGGFVTETKRGAFDVQVSAHPAENAQNIPANLILHPVVNGSIVVPGSRGIVDTPIPGRVSSG
jgi:hypothetical protein